MIVIDPGHGGSDPGAVGNGLREKDVVLAISLEVAKLLRLNGEQVKLTRESDTYLELKNRTPTCDISVSIHCNAFNGVASGLETWVALKNKPLESKKLGHAIQKNILKEQKFTDRGLKSKLNNQGTADYLYMLREAKGVPVLVEVGFIDNKTDANALKNIQNIAKGVARGVMEYRGKEFREVEETKVIIEGQEYKAFIIDKQTFVEVRRPFEKTGFTVNYNPKTKFVEIVK